ncbi:MAG: ribosome maturation factor RimM [Hyphococcus sp.]|nr:MAG: ribosome maturation factor RimM [Marinicaulis sp.]
MTKDDDRVCLGAFAGAHGVKGDAKVKTFTEAPENIAAYGPVYSEDGKQRFTLKLIKTLKGDLVLVRAPEIKSREEAENLKGARLYVSRDQLPTPDEEEFYLSDLVGLNAINENGDAFGIVNAVYNFGAGDLLELKNIPNVKGVQLIAFTKENVPEISLANRTITVMQSIIDESDDPNDEPAR